MKTLRDDILCKQIFECDADKKIIRIRITSNTEIRLIVKNLETDIYEIAKTGKDFILDSSDVKSNTLYEYTGQIHNGTRYINITRTYYFARTNNKLSVYSKKPAFIPSKENIDLKILRNDTHCKQIFKYNSNNEITAVDIFSDKEVRLILKNTETNTYEATMTGKNFTLSAQNIKSDTIYKYSIQLHNGKRYENISKSYYIIYHNNGLHIYDREPVFRHYTDDLFYSRRCNVTIQPFEPIPYTRGFAGVYENKIPVPESRRLTMGCQLFFFPPYQEAESFSDEVVIYGDVPNSGYGHFLLDAMARLWYAKDHPDIPIIWNGERLPSFAPAIFDIVGIRNRHLFLKKPTRFKEVIFPFPGVAIGNYFLSGHEKFLGAYPGKPLIPGKKLYLSRKNIKGRNLVDEEAIEKLVSRYGFTIYYPEEHPLTDQLDELSSSEVVLGAEGSALHSAVLLKQPIRTRFYAIARHRMGSGVFEHIRICKNIQYITFNLLANNKRITANSEFNIDIKKLEHILSETNGLTEDNSAILNDYAIIPDCPQSSFLDVLDKFRVTLTETELSSLHILHLLKAHFAKLDTFKDVLRESKSPDYDVLSSFLETSRQDLLSSIALQFRVPKLTQ